ncbi:hypothetical protein Tsp_07773 [Trichinella spiralis]|uniref:hypothetical protein n=1 Tax=Trichinella spiralis TaxID=6334 RepID=UPI0001EFCC12|nr:hypothetical protein Tsp_07773 [Trichinella spiralis]
MQIKTKSLDRKFVKCRTNDGKYETKILVHVHSRKQPGRIDQNGIGTINPTIFGNDNLNGVNVTFILEFINEPSLEELNVDFLKTLFQTTIPRINVESVQVEEIKQPIIPVPTPESNSTEPTINTNTTIPSTPNQTTPSNKKVHFTRNSIVRPCTILHRFRLAEDVLSESFGLSKQIRSVGFVELFPSKHIFQRQQYVQYE